MVRKRFLLLLGFIFIISITILVTIYIHLDALDRADLEIEVGKAMLNIIAVVIIGTIIQVIVRDFEQRSTYRDLLRKDLSEEVSKLYSRAKHVRRRLRAHVTNEKIDSKIFDDLLSEISDIQLGLERYKRIADEGSNIGILPESIFSDLSSMEKYLSKLVSEYEETRPLDPASSIISLTDLITLKDFIGNYKNSGFRAEFAIPYDNAARSVALESMKDLLRKQKKKN